MEAGPATQDTSVPTVAVVVPTRDRTAYLDVTLESLTRQRGERPHELLVVDDGPSAETAAVAAAHGVRCIATVGGHGLNAARNTGMRATTAPLVAFVDDDVVAPPGWLDALAAGAERHHEADALGGPIRARFEGGGPRGCGREGPPITTLDLGPEDVEAEMVWGANFTVRRSAWERIGPFDERLRRGHGDEEEWLERLRASGGRIAYVAAAGLEHRRTAADARLLPLARAAYHRGRGARASDVRRDRAPGTLRELRVLVGCGWHTLRRACPQGIVMGAHSAGRVVELWWPKPTTEEEPVVATSLPEPATFLSGDAGDVTAPWRRAKRTLGECVCRAADVLLLTGPRVDRLAARQAPLRVLVIGIARPGSLLPAALPQLRSQRHRVTVALGALGPADPALAADTVATDLDGGKFENLNAVLAAAPDLADVDWLIVVDDDIELPPRFLDRFLALCERFRLDVAQPAQTLRSHSAWRVTRRRPASLARETRFAEIGPVTAFRGAVAAELTPFPPLRFGWGLDLHWGAVASQRGWRMGVVDATPVRHETAVVAASYDGDAAIEEAARFLAGRPYVAAWDAERTLATHRRAGVSRRTR
jgi:GT2 family glycosyltransferase